MPTTQRHTDQSAALPNPTPTQIPKFEFLSLLVPSLGDSGSCMGQQFLRSRLSVPLKGLSKGVPLALEASDNPRRESKRDVQREGREGEG
jgi:hypothetical protein